MLQIVIILCFLIYTNFVFFVFFSKNVVINGNIRGQAVFDMTIWLVAFVELYEKKVS